MNPQELEALAPLYALDALDGEDLARFNEALKESEPLRALVREYRDAASTLPLSLEPVAPAPALRSRVLEAVAPAAPRSAPVFTRVFWAVAAIALFVFVVKSLLNPVPTRELLVKGAPGAPAASGRLLYTGRSVELSIHGLPALPAGKCYQLWHIGPLKTPVDQGTFALDASGTLRGWDGMKYEISPGCAFAVTMEPVGGSKTPTAPLYGIARN